jgi:kynureninase
MSRILANSGFYDEGLIDHRNTRPLAVAFATILIVWTLAFGLVSVSAQLHAQSGHFANGCARAISTMIR